MPTLYLITDIETVPDSHLWNPIQETKKIELEKKVTPKEKQFLSIAMSIARAGTPLHSDDAEKLSDIASRLDEEEKDLASEAKTLALKYLPEPKDDFAPHHAHRVLVIGGVVLGPDLIPIKIGGIQNAGTFEMDEKDLNLHEKQALEKWNTYNEKERPVLVTWYGRGFDLPVLSLRSMKYGISMKWYHAENYRYRYSEDHHVDLCDTMADYGALRGSLKLDAISKLFGLPGKPEGIDGKHIDGSKVSQMWKDGKTQDVANYCLTDCLQTAWIFMRWRLVKGRIDIESYRQAASKLYDMADSMNEMKFFTHQINKDKLLLL